MGASSIFLPLKSVFDDRGIKDAQKKMGQLGKTMKGALGALGIATSLSAVVSQLDQMGRAAAADAKSQALLANSMRNTIGASDSQISATEAAIQKFSSLYAVLDDNIRPSMSQFVRVTGDATKATELTNLALNVSAGTGRDLGAVTIALGKAYQGNTASLAKLGINVKGMKDPMAELAKQFDGAAAAAANVDPYQRIQVALDNTQETIGAALLPSMNRLADFLNSDAWKAGVENVATQLDNMITGGWVVADQMGNIVEDINASLSNLGVDVDLSRVGNAFDWLLGNPAFKLLGIIGGAAKERAALNAGSGFNTTTLEGILKASGQMQAPYEPPPPTGQKEADKRAAEAAKRAAAAAKAAQAARDAYKKLADSMAEFKTAMGDTLLAVRPLEVATRVIGDFEQASIDAFTKVQEKVAEALKSGLISASSFEALTKYAAKESKVLNEIAAQRDVLAKKIDIAKGLVSTVRDYMNITEMGATTSEITSNFKTVIDKTVAFGKNLLSLKKSGIDKNLFAQILGAGLEAGGATAQAIVDGGDSAISELNMLFKDLNSAAEGIASASTDVMYQVGEEMISNGFIAGLMSQDSELVKAATVLAQTFADTFSTGLSTAMAAQLGAIQPPSVNVPMSSTVTPLSGGIANQLQSLGFKNSADAYIRKDSMGQSFLTTKAGITINVNAGIGTDGKSVAQAIIDEIKRYERANGAVWVNA